MQPRQYYAFDLLSLMSPEGLQGLREICPNVSLLF